MTDPRPDEPVPSASAVPEAPGAVPAAFEEVDTDQIPETDIVFECPYCGKSLSIDQRGAGLVIECTACQQMVTVPIPDGMELSDIDLPPEERETQLSNMRVVLGQAQRRVAELTEENATLREANSAAEKSFSVRNRRLNDLRALCHSLLKNQTEAAELLSRLRRLLDEA